MDKRYAAVDNTVTTNFNAETIADEELQQAQLNDRFFPEISRKLYPEIRYSK